MRGTSTASTTARSPTSSAPDGTVKSRLNRARVELARVSGSGSARRLRHEVRSSAPSRLSPEGACDRLRRSLPPGRDGPSLWRRSGTLRGREPRVVLRDLRASPRRLRGERQAPRHPDRSPATRHADRYSRRPLEVRAAARRRARGDGAPLSRRDRRARSLPRPPETPARSPGGAPPARRTRGRGESLPPLAKRLAGRGRTRLRRLPRPGGRTRRRPPLGRPKRSQRHDRRGRAGSRRGEGGGRREARHRTREPPQETPDGAARLTASTGRSRSARRRRRRGPRSSSAASSGAGSRPSRSGPRQLANRTLPVCVPSIERDERSRSTEPSEPEEPRR